MYILSTLCGFHTEVEEHTSKGRMDMTIKTDKYIYLFEFKFNSSASIVATNRLFNICKLKKYRAS